MVVCFSLYFRLALYVYEYLLHVGAQKAAQTFLSEVSTCYAVASESGGSAGAAGSTWGIEIVFRGFSNIIHMPDFRLLSCTLKNWTL